MANDLSMDQAFLKQLDELIETHLEDEQFGVEKLAAELGLSRSQLHRKLNGLTGKSTSQYIRECRLEKAMEMLQNNVATASEIAFRVGFSSPTYFNTSFHQYFGYPPGEVKFRNQSERADENEIQPLNNGDTVIIKRKWYNLRTFIIGMLALILVVSIGYYNYANSNNTATNGSKEPTTFTENSIAVLPFKNMSGNSENEAFCDGMTTAIISRLSKIKGINKVISQTSMMNYKDNKDKSIMVIANELDVHYVLESGFQKSGDHIKINLQLIDGTSDKLVWSEVYEGQYDSIFKIQARVAEMVAKQLDADITAEEQKDIQKAMTNNTEAYENFLMGQQVWSTWSNQSVIAARRFFEKAVALDSNFAEAYYRIGLSYSVMGIWNGNMTKAEANKLSKPYFDKALQLDPDNYELLNYLAYDASFDWDYKKADSIFQKLYDLGYEHDRDGFYFKMGNSDLIINNYFEILEDPTRDESDPSIGWRSLPYALIYRGETDEARHLMEVGLKLHPNYDAFYDHFGNAYLAMGDYEKAIDIWETGLLLAGKRYVSMVVHLAAAYYLLGEQKKASELLNEAINRAQGGEPEVNVFIAHYYARLGNNDEAFKWLNIAYQKHEVDLGWLKSDPNLLLLKGDPRYDALCKKMGFLEL